VVSGTGAGRELERVRVLWPVQEKERRPAAGVDSAGEVGEEEVQQDLWVESLTAMLVRQGRRQRTRACILPGSLSRSRRR
jgi:hypothetical protein